MKNYKVKDLMVPLSEYATVSVGCTLHEAVQSLEKSHRESENSIYKHRAILILNEKRDVIGKLSHLDALRALSPEHNRTYGTEELNRFGFSNSFIRKLHQQRQQQNTPLEELCRNAEKHKVEDYMCAPKEDECIDFQSDLPTAIHQLVQENTRSLLVKKEGKITGILRLTDLFSSIFHTIVTPPQLP